MLVDAQAQPSKFQKAPGAATSPLPPQRSALTTKAKSPIFVELAGKAPRMLVGRAAIDGELR